MKPVTPGHRVLIKPDSLDLVDPAYAAARRMNLELLEQTQRQETQAVDIGTVVQIGPTAYKDFGGVDNWCKVGDRVSYVRHGGKMITDPDNKETKWLVLNDEDVIMVWEK